MPEIIKSVAERTTAEIVIEKSRFIGYCAHVTSEEEAKAFVDEIKAKHKDATHNCFGFIADKTGAMQRFSDDGEPQGTAGMPILDVIKNKGLFETAVVVTRYFGGIKLGAGGLVRAYTATAVEVLKKTKICFWQTCQEVKVEVDYPQIDVALKFFTTHDCLQKDSEYSEKVTFTIQVKKNLKEQFKSELIDCLQGKVTLFDGDEYFYPFPKE